MFEQSKSKNEIELKNRNSIFKGIAVGAIFMGFMGIQLLCELSLFEEGVSAGDIFGLVFICVWIFATFWMGIMALIASTKKIIVNDEGVQCRTLFSKHKLLWSEIQDWGLSYCGQTRGEGNTYHFYFSTRHHPIKNKYSKRLKGKMIKTVVIGIEYYEYVNEIIPFCTMRTGVPPFIGEDAHHWI